MSAFQALSLLHRVRLRALVCQLWQLLLDPVLWSVLVVGLSLTSSFSRAQDELLELSLDELLDVEVVSASKRLESVFDASAAVFVITAEDIRRSGVTSIPEALRLAPGVDAAQLDSNKWALSVRGYTQRFANKLQVLIDGRPVYSPVFSGVFWDAQDTMLEDIERIEVIRGPGATLWGANAVNGVINIITKRTEDTQGTLISALAGNQERGTIAARYGGSVGAMGNYRVFARYFDRAENRVSGEDAAADEWEQSRLGFRLDLNPSDRDTVFASGELFNSNAGETVTSLSLTEPFSELQPERQDADGYNLSLRWDRTLGADDTLSIQAFVDTVDRDWQLADIDRAAYDVAVEYRTTRLSNQNLILGAGYRLNDDRITTGASGRVTVVPESRQEEVFNIFLQDEISLAANVRATIGSKFEYNDFTGLEVQPSVRLLWQPSSMVSLWASASRAVRTPGRADRDYSIVFDVVPPPSSDGLLPSLPTAVLVSGHPDFDAEELMAYEIGLKVRPTANLSLDFASFYFEYDDIRTVVPGGLSCIPDVAPFPGCLGDQATQATEFLTVQGNLAIADSRGFELSTDWRPSPRWRLQGNYSFFSGVEDAREGLSLGGSDGLATTPRHLASLRLGYIPASSVEADLWLRYVDEVVSLTGAEIDAYSSADARLAWQVQPKVELAIVGKGLLNDAQEQLLSAPNDLPLTEIRRSVFVQLRVNF
ncbi:MAG: TonB-dependent receptor [Pseudomonadota bacterium]